MRTTQYIGLNARAVDIVTTFIRLDISHSTFGMFEEEVPLGVWQLDKRLYIEFVQASPWSSGPMIFTALCGPEGLLTESLWREDPTLSRHHGDGQEYDQVAGTFYV